MEDPNKRIFINDRIYEGCGDCSEQSNCLSVIPIDTEWSKNERLINHLVTKITLALMDFVLVL